MRDQVIKQNNREKLTGFVFDIQRYSLGDGGGIRTTVFMKGCNMRCRWCQNPESFNIKPELGFRSDRCMKCGACAAACSQKAINANGSFETRHDMCISCGACVRVCPTKARYMIGRGYTTAELLSIVQRDTIFYKESGGGVTLSGGEAALQFEFVYEFLKECKGRGLNTAIETNGTFDKKRFKLLLPLLDQIYFDLKLISAEIHELYTGMDNRIILDNAAWLNRCFDNLTFRIPLIPGATLTDENIKATVEFLTNLDVHNVEFCLYQNGWENKLHRLNTKQVPLGQQSLSEPDAADTVKFFNASGISVKIN